MAPQILLKGRTLSMLGSERDRKEGWTGCKEVGQHFDLGLGDG